MNEVSGDSVSEIGQDSLDPRQQLTVNNKTYHYFSLTAAAQQLGDITKLPYSLRILIENLLRHESNQANVAQHIQAFVNRGLIDNPEERIPFYPTRVVLDEASGIEATIALASMRETLKTANEPVDQANPAVQTDLIIPQHEDAAGNIKHYPLLSWGQQALKNFNVVTPTTRTCEPIDYDYLAKTAWSCALAEEVIAYPDSHIGTHRYAAAANALGILSWHTDGIEAETAMLGLPLPLSVPKVVGIELKGKLNTDASAADLACAINAQLNEENASGKIVEFCGDALEHLSVDDRAVISCSIPETGALCGYFPIDPQTIEGLALRGRDSHTLKLIKAYSQTQQLWRDDSQPSFDYQITIDLSAIPSANAITKQANGLKNQSPIETKDRHAKKEGTQEKNDGINAQQPPMDSPASKTYCWTPTSAEIKPIQIPYAHSENQPGHFKTARIRALLADTPISNGATTYEPPIENLSAESDSDTFIVFAGKNCDGQTEYTAKTLYSQGVKAVIAESFNPTYRTNLIAQGLLPLEFIDGDSWQALGLSGEETIEIDLPKEMYPFEPIVMVIHRANGRRELVELTARLDTEREIHYYQSGGILAFSLRQMTEQS